MFEEQITFDNLIVVDRKVVPVDREVAKPFIEAIHYSRKYPSNIVYAFGLYRGGYWKE